MYDLKFSVVRLYNISSTFIYDSPKSRSPAGRHHLKLKETSMNERAIQSLMSTVSSLQVFDGQTHCGYLIVCLVKHCKYDLSKYVDNAT